MSSTYTECPRDVARKPTTFSTYGDFVEGFLNGLSQSLESDFAANMNPAKRLCKVKERGADVSPTAKACAHRFALGVDDAMYLNAGVSLLCVAGTETRDLAPANLYAADTLEATKKALEALEKTHKHGLRSAAPGMLNLLLKQIRNIVAGVDELGKLIKDDRARALLKEGATFDPNAEGIAAMQTLVNELNAIVLNSNDDSIVRRFINFIDEDERKKMQDNLDRRVQEKVRNTIEEFKSLQDAVQSEKNQLEDLSKRLKNREADINGKMDNLKSLRSVYETEKAQLEKDKDNLKSEKTAFEKTIKQINALETRLRRQENNQVLKEGQLNEQEQALKDQIDIIEDLKKRLDQREGKVRDQESLQEKIDKLEEKTLAQKEQIIREQIKLTSLQIKNAEQRKGSEDDVVKSLKAKRDELRAKITSTNALAKAVRVADSIKAQFNQHPMFDAHFHDRVSKRRLSTDEILNVDALFWHEAGDAFSQTRSFDEAVATPGLSEQGRKILASTAAALKLTLLDRTLIGDPASESEGNRIVCALTHFLAEASKYLGSYEIVDGVKEKVEALLPSGKAEERRAGIWNEMLKDAALATDRLWIFVRTLSGLIGEDAESILEAADDDTIRASKEADRRRNEIAETVSKFQAKLIETLVGGLVKESKLQLTTPKDAADQLVVVDSETAKQIRDLASGESGRPFFEANVALRNLQESSKGQPRRLSDLIGEFGEVSKALHASLVEELKVGEGVAGSTLSNLSKPANSYFVKLRDDTSAAIRAAYDRFLVEYELKVGGRRVKLWELIEGADNLLSTRFAELCGHVLVQNRLSTGVSAMYVGRNQTAVNAAQAHVSLARLINQAASYASRVPAADWKGDDVVGHRDNYFENARDKVDTWASGAGGAYGPARSQFVPSWQTTYSGMVRGLQY